MGGMGFIESNQCRVMYNNTRISLNMLDATRQLSMVRNNIKIATTRTLRDQLLLEDLKIEAGKPPT
eukprot:GSA25T00024762001.1